MTNACQFSKSKGKLIIVLAFEIMPAGDYYVVVSADKTTDERNLSEYNAPTFSHRKSYSRLQLQEVILPATVTGSHTAGHSYRKS